MQERKQPSKTHKAELRIDPADGLLMMGVRSWAFEKHRLLQDYVAITHGVRQQRPTSTLIDLYCGHGRVFDQKSPLDVRDNGVVSAYKKSLEGKNPNGTYSTVIIGDADHVAVDACRARLEELGANVIALYGTSEETVDKAIELCPRQGLKLAFLDPYKPEELPFSVLKRLSRLGMMDFVVYYGQMDITRNLDSEYLKSESRYDKFAPGWKEAIDVRSMSIENARAQFLEYWLSLMLQLGFKHARHKPLMRSDERNAPLYRLILFSSHSLAERFWNNIAKSPQGSFNF